MVGKVDHGLNTVRSALPTKPAGSRSKSRPQSLEGQHQGDGKPQSVTPTANVRKVALETIVGSGLASMTELRPEPQGSKKCLNDGGRKALGDPH